MIIRNFTRWAKRRWTKTRTWRKNLILSVLVGHFHLYLLLHIPGVPGSGLLGNYLEPRVMDFWFLIRGRLDPPAGVVVVAVDESSHEKLGVSKLKPWPRELTAQFLEKIAPAKPREAFLDFIYGELIDPASDKRLSEALRLSPTRLARVKVAQIRTEADGKQVREEHWIDSHEFFSSKAMGSFNANLRSTQGIVRHFSFDSSEPFPAIAEAIPKEDRFVGLAGPTRRDFINYYGRPGSIMTIPFYQVLEESPEKINVMFGNRYVFLGQKLLFTYAAMQSDTFLTPTLSPMAGVEIHASTVANLLDGSWIRRLGWVEEALLALLLGSLGGYLIISFKPSIGALILVGFILLWGGGAYLGFLHNWFVPGITLSLIILPFVFVLSCIRYYFRARSLERAMGL